MEQILELEPADEFGGFISPARYQDQRLCRELSLELIAEEPSLNQQAALIADFVSRTFQLLEDNPPAAS